MLAIIIGLAMVVLYLLHKRQLWTIPGPSGIPLLGNALQLDQTRPIAVLYDWAKQYGAIFKMNLLGENVVVVNSLEGLREMFYTKSEQFAGRAKIFRGNFFLNEPDIALQDINPRWSVLKNTCMAGIKQVYIMEYYENIAWH